MCRKILTFIVLLMMILPMTGCYDRVELDDLAYPLAIGVDKGITDTVKVTLQFDKATTQASGEKSGGDKGEEESGIITIESPTVISGVNTVSAISPKRLNLSHVKVLVFSEEIAKEDGIYKYIQGFIRSREVRPTILIMVSKSTAEEYIKSVKPALSPSITRYYELYENMNKRSGLGNAVQFQEYYFKQHSMGASPIAMMVGVSPYKSSSEFKKVEPEVTGRLVEGRYEAGEIPRTGGGRSESTGFAVFRAGKIVGEMNAQEGLFYQMASGQFRNSELSLADPASPGNYVILTVKQSRKPVHEVKLVDGKPDIQVKVIMEGDISAIQSGVPYDQEENLRIIEQVIEQEVSQGIKKMLEKTSAEYGSDIIGFGDIYKRKLLTWQDWLNVNWPEIYKKSTFQIEVDFKIRRTGLLIGSHPNILTEE